MGHSFTHSLMHFSLTFALTLFLSHTHFQIETNVFICVLFLIKMIRARMQSANEHDISHL